MNRVLVLFLLCSATVLVADESAIKNPSYQCATEQITGFSKNEDTGQWEDDQHPYTARSQHSIEYDERRALYIVHIVDSLRSRPLELAECPTGFEQGYWRGFLHCEGTVKFVFSQRTDRFVLFTWQHGYLNDDPSGLTGVQIGSCTET